MQENGIPAWARCLSRGGGVAGGDPPHPLPTMLCVCVCPPPQVQLINDAYNAVVDAVLGAEGEAGEGREPCAAILATLKHVRIPIVSLDVPSGPAPRSPPFPHPRQDGTPPRSSPCPPRHHHGLSARVAEEPPRCPLRVGTALGTPPALLSPPPRQAWQHPCREPGLADAFRASTINNKLPELRHDVI